MKISDPGKPSIPNDVNNADGSAAVGGPKKGEKAFELGKTDPANPTAATRGATSPPSGVTTSDLTGELKLGRLLPAQAMEKVLDRVLDKQLGANAPAPVREKVRAALEDAIANDPLLAEKMRQLAG